ncbi:helix-turn-helix domain-containing protein [Polaribacter sargassicola]|uniref:helix-turn-helix domain-containing protein n=1 Tax=Polaribacter sargassicola TaxID=2836891 RepID=UPI001F1DCE85|nr:helix-turn-helix domain-containing protein [Polaribacter sp. DS7-9]MCG1035574.1 AraC family transcriptional regulator [Polaribacter sp. DS7-9]
MKRINKKKLLLILICCCNLVFSQTNEKDQFYIDKIISFTDSNNDSLIYYANRLKDSKNLCNYYYAINIEAKAFYQKGNLKESEKKTLFVLKNLKTANTIDKTCFKNIKNNALNRLFWVYKNQNKFHEAFDVIMEKRKFINSFPTKDNYDKSNLISTDKNLAIIKKILGLHEESRTLLKEMLPKLPSIYKGLNVDENTLKLNIASTLNLIGESYLETYTNNNSHHLDSAKTYFRKAFEVSKTFKPAHKNSEALYQLRLSEILIAQKNYKEALKIIRKYNAFSKEFRIKQVTNNLKTICFYQLKNNDSTLYYGKQFLKEHSKKSIDKKSLISIYDILANQYYKNKQIDSAYKYSELTIKELNDLNKNKTEANKSHHLYDYNNALELNTLILNKEKGNKNILIIGILIITLISFFIVYILSKKNKNITNDLVDVKAEINKEPIQQKKEYNIDKNLEIELLKGINKLEKSTDFLSADFNINFLAKKLNTNTSYLSYLINKEYNQTFKQYTTTLRIEYLIKKLNEESKFRNYTIQSLAEEIGYTNASSFTRAFKKYKGVTPSEFIKSLKNN